MVVNRNTRCATSLPHAAACPACDARQHGQRLYAQMAGDSPGAVATGHHHATQITAVQQLFHDLGEGFSNRFSGLRTPAWRAALHDALRQGLTDPADGGRLKVSFEVIYGHAFKPAPRFAAKPQTNIDVESLRRAAKGTRREPIQ